MIRSFLAAIAIGGVYGCTAKGSSPADTSAADTAGAVVKGQTVDSAPAELPPPADATGNLTGEQANRGPTDIGRDSAYGPIGTMDEKGNIGPIKK